MDVVDLFSVFSEIGENIETMTVNLPDKVVEEIRAFALERKIAKVVLFGSRARTTNRERSDVDLAVVRGDFDAFYWDVQERIDSLLSFDVVNLTNASDELKKEIERDGVAIYEEV